VLVFSSPECLPVEETAWVFVWLYIHEMTNYNER
jgi:hypothetical protein